MKKVLVFGSFDILHDGHRSLFRQARKHGDRLAVIVARDATYERLRGHKPLHDEYARLKNVAEESLVDEALLGDPHDPYRSLRIVRPDVVCLGYDQEWFVDDLSAKLSSFGLRSVPVIRLEPFSPERHKSSLLKKARR